MALRYVRRTLCCLSADVDADFHFQDYQFKNFELERVKTTNGCKMVDFRGLTRKGLIFKIYCVSNTTFKFIECQYS
jgi:hypothetical protein